MPFLLKLFAGVSLQGPRGLITGPAAQRHRLALLALLATSRQQTLSRDKLLAWLWQARDAEHARGLLNQAVHALRRELGDAALLSVGDDLRLNPEIVQCDVIAFEEALAAGQHARAAGLYAGPFLDGFFLSDAREFEHWVARERGRLAAAYASALEALAQAAEGRKDFRAAAQWWRARAAHDPYSGHAALRLMRALEAAGDRAGALQQARVHAALLREEFDAEPDPEVTAFAERLRVAPSARSAPEPVAIGTALEPPRQGPPPAGSGEKPA
ncbi:MAG TPA: BTAD domain-containing putative transcriptional regulator, partial [bacterium]|nr:BTAD domain-containing putative transcriptional regulator [bacterium]